MESCSNLSVEVRMHQADVETLKGTKDKAIREAGEASMRVDVAERRAEDVEVALKGAIEKNSQLQERMRELEA